MTILNINWAGKAHKSKYNIRKLKYFCFIYVHDTSISGNFKFLLKKIEWTIKEGKSMEIQSAEALWIQGAYEEAEESAYIKLC